MKSLTQPRVLLCDSTEYKLFSSRFDGTRKEYIRLDGQPFFLGSRLERFFYPPLVAAEEEEENKPSTCVFFPQSSHTSSLSCRGSLPLSPPFHSSFITIVIIILYRVVFTPPPPLSLSHSLDRQDIPTPEVRTFFYKYLLHYTRYLNVQGSYMSYAEEYYTGTE